MDHLHPPAPDGDYDFFTTPPTGATTPGGTSSPSSSSPASAPGAFAPSRFGGPPDGPPPISGAPGGGFAPTGFGGVAAAPLAAPRRRSGVPVWLKVLVPVVAVVVVAAGVLLVPPFVKAFRAQQTFDATSVATPATAAGFTLDTSPQSVALAERITAQVPTGPGYQSAAGIYVNRQTGQGVIAAAIRSDAPRVDVADRDISDAVTGLASGGLKVTGLAAVDPGRLGGALRCGTALIDGKATRTCVSADVAVTTIMVFLAPKTPDATVVAMREAIEVR